MVSADLTETIASSVGVRKGVLPGRLQIRVRKPLSKVKISISDAYFSEAKTVADFFNRIGQKQSFILASRVASHYDQVIIRKELFEWIA